MVTSWFGNRWLRSWRTPALRATQRRRLDWYLERGARLLGLEQLSAEEGEHVRVFFAHGGPLFLAYPAGERNAVIRCLPAYRRPALCPVIVIA